MKTQTWRKILLLFFAVIAIVQITAFCEENSKHSKKGQEAAASFSNADMAPFKKISEDTLALVENGKMAEAKTKIKELETAWDDAETTLKPKSPSKWNSIDKSIDKALALVRSSNPDKNACASALKTAIAKFTVNGAPADLKQTQQ